MRSRRTWIAAALLLGMARAGSAAQYQPADILKIRPTQPGVEYETPTDPAVVAACKVETVTDAKKKQIGYALRDPQGKLLRKFVDSDGNAALDQYSYYQDGFEVYRESDLNGDKAIDECRWLNMGGTRIAKIVDGTRIASWKRISAEEASKVLVQALVSGDMGLLETVMASSEEMVRSGLPKGFVEKVAGEGKDRAEQVKSLVKTLVGWNKQTVWSRLDKSMPGTIPADPATGLGQDVTVYENAVIFAGPANGQPAPAEMAFLQAPELIKVGEVWKFVELPRAINPKDGVVAFDGGLRAWLFRGEAGPGIPKTDPKLEEALKALADYDKQNAEALAGGGKKEAATYHVGRIRLLREVVKVTEKPDEQLLYNKQVIDSLAGAYQTGAYPAGREALDRIIAQGDKLGTYAAFRKIASEFAAASDDSNADMLKVNKKWLGDLKDFLDKFPKSDEAPDVLLQLASANEFNAEEDEARKYYTQLSRDFPETEPGKRAAGALRRLDLVDKPISLRGPGLRNETIDVARYKGKPVLIQFWATWADPVRRDLPELIKVYEKYRGKGLQIVGVDLDNERKDLDAFLSEHPLPWPIVHEPGGMESRLATEYGIISLPTMILVNVEGKVVSRSIRTAAELERQLDKLLADKQSGVALGAN